MLFFELSIRRVHSLNHTGDPALNKKAAQKAPQT